MAAARNSGLGEKGRLLGILSAIIVLGAGGSSLLAFFASRQAIRASIEGEALPAAAESVYSTIRLDLVEPLFVSSMMANDTFLHDWAARGEGDLPAIRSYLGEVARRYGAITAFFVSDATGRYYCPEGLLKTVSRGEPRDEWFYRVRSMSSPYELNVDPDLAHGDELTIFVNYRVIDASGSFVGASGVGITVASLRDLVEKVREDYGTSIYFVDREGRVVAGSPSGLAVAPPSLLDDPALAPAAREALASGGGSFRYARGRETILLRVQDLPELSWYLFAEKPEGQAVAGARRALYLNLGLSVLVLALVLAASIATVNRYQSRLERSASHDPLTGALNRLAFGEAAEFLVKAARRSGERLAVVMLDIDEFKKVNDRLGHPAGDAVLVEVAARAKAAIRETDLFCRWGGEEFLAVLRDCGLNDAAATAEKLRRAIAEGTRAACPAGVTASCGAAELGPDEGFESLVARADAALLEAKAGGRDRVVLA